MIGYKQSDVGTIPNEWEAKSLIEIGETLIGLTYSPLEVRKYGTLVLRSSNVQNGILCFENKVFVEAKIPERIMVRPGDILICVRNGSRDLIGKSAMIDERAIGMTFGAFMGVFRSDFGNFLKHMFQSGILKKQINEHLGATINQITNSSLNSFKVPFPQSSEERSEIANTLNDFDKLLSVLDQVIAKKRNLKQATMQQLLNGRTRLPGFIGKWETKAFKHLLVRLHIKSHQIYTSNYQVSGKFPIVDQGKKLIVGITAVFPGSISTSFSTFAARSMPDDPLVSYFGKVAFFDNLLSSNNKFSPKLSPDVSPAIINITNFLLYSFNK